MILALIMLEFTILVYTKEIEYENDRSINAMAASIEAICQSDHDDNFLMMSSMAVLYSGFFNKLTTPIGIKKNNKNRTMLNIFALRYPILKIIGR